MPFRVFAAGEVLTAANVNDYLAEQAIATFAGTAARASAITAPTEGQFAYLSDSDSLTFYNGSAWVNAGSAIAGTALSSGTATSGQVLTANGSGAVTFSTPTTPSLILLSTTSFSAVSSVSLPANTFTSAYENYRVYLQITSTSTSTPGKMRFRASGTDNTSNVYYSAGQFNYAYNSGHFADATNPSTISCAVFASEDNGNGISVMEFMRPQVAARSLVKGLYSAKFVNAHFQVCHDSDTQFDSASFIANSGTITGKVMCYAYQQ